MTLYPTFRRFPIRVYPSELGIQSCSTHISANSPFPGHSSPHSKVDREKSPTVQPWWRSRSLFIVEGCQSLKKDITWTRHTRIGAFELWSLQAADWYLIDEMILDLLLFAKKVGHSHLSCHTSVLVRWLVERLNGIPKSLHHPLLMKFEMEANALIWKTIYYVDGNKLDEKIIGSQWTALATWDSMGNPI